MIIVQWVLFTAIYVLIFLGFFFTIRQLGQILEALS